VVSRLKNLGYRKTARIDKVVAVWSEDEKMVLKRPHGSPVFLALLAS